VYRIGYHPPIERWDNKFHNLRITAEGKGGIGGSGQQWLDWGRDRPTRELSKAAVGQAHASAIGIRATATPNDKRRKGSVSKSAWMPRICFLNPTASGPRSGSDHPSQRNVGLPAATAKMRNGCGYRNSAAKKWKMIMIGSSVMLDHLLSPNGQRVGRSVL